VARFDWYQATVRAPVPDLRACLADLAPGGAWSPARKAPHGYAFADELHDGDGVVARVWWGGCHQHPHAVISGEAAQPAAELLRAGLADHSVSRADVCQDYAEAGAYDALQGIALEVARDRKVKVGTAGDHLVTMEGRTLYLGATSSHTRLRLYDKAAELRAQFARDPVRLATVPQELARLECQVRPQTPEAKRAAAQVDPVALMGSASWMREVMRLVAGLELDPFEAGRPWRQSDDTRAWAALLAQYGGLLRRVYADAGSWECVGLQIGSDLAERDAQARR
jgi:hypothetical protein